MTYRAQCEARRRRTRRRRGRVYSWSSFIQLWNIRPVRFVGDVLECVAEATIPGRIRSITVSGTFEKPAESPAPVGVTTGRYDVPPFELSLTPEGRALLLGESNGVAGQDESTGER